MEPTRDEWFQLFFNTGQPWQDDAVCTGSDCENIKPFYPFRVFIKFLIEFPPPHKGHTRVTSDNWAMTQIPYTRVPHTSRSSLAKVNIYQAVLSSRQASWVIERNRVFTEDFGGFRKKGCAYKGNWFIAYWFGFQ